MSDLISRQDAIDALKKIMFTHFFECGEYIGEDTREFSIMNAEKALDVIETLPSAEPNRTVKVKRVPYVEEINYDSDGECECGKWVDVLWSYCPRCGAKLDWSE